MPRGSATLQTLSLPGCHVPQPQVPETGVLSKEGEECSLTHPKVHALTCWSPLSPGTRLPLRPHI